MHSELEKLQLRARNMKGFNVRIEKLYDGTFKMWETHSSDINVIMWTRYKNNLKEVAQELKELKESML